VADHLNCALWITRFHPHASLGRLFDQVRTGTVFAVSVNPPEGVNPTCAVKLVFMRPSAAAHFLALLMTDPGIIINGIRLTGTYNRMGYHENHDNNVTRVLHIRGPPHIPEMTRDFWDGDFGYFEKYVVYQLECFREWQEGDQKCLECKLSGISLFPISA
jgi:hypothetical protein